MSLALCGSLLLGGQRGRGSYLEGVAAVSLDDQPVVSEDRRGDLETIPLLHGGRARALLFGKLKVGIVVGVPCGTNLAMGTLAIRQGLLQDSPISSRVGVWRLITGSADIWWTPARHGSCFCNPLPIRHLSGSYSHLLITCNMK